MAKFNPQILSEEKLKVPSGADVSARASQLSGSGLAQLHAPTLQAPTIRSSEVPAMVSEHQTFVSQQALDQFGQVMVTRAFEYADDMARREARDLSYKLNDSLLPIVEGSDTKAGINSLSGRDYLQAMPEALQKIDTVVTDTLNTTENALTRKYLLEQAEGIRKHYREAVVSRRAHEESVYEQQQAAVASNYMVKLITETAGAGGDVPALLDAHVADVSSIFRNPMSAALYVQKAVPKVVVESIKLMATDAEGLTPRRIDAVMNWLPSLDQYGVSRQEAYSVLQQGLLQRKSVELAALNQEHTKLIRQQDDIKTSAMRLLVGEDGSIKADDASRQAFIAYARNQPGATGDTIQWAEAMAARAHSHYNTPDEVTAYLTNNIGQFVDNPQKLYDYPGLAPKDVPKFVKYAETMGKKENLQFVNTLKENFRRGVQRLTSKDVAPIFTAAAQEAGNSTVKSVDNAIMVAAASYAVGSGIPFAEHMRQSLDQVLPAIFDTYATSLLPARLEGPKERFSLIRPEDQLDTAEGMTAINALLDTRWLKVQKAIDQLPTDTPAERRAALTLFAEVYTQYNTLRQLGGRTPQEYKMEKINQLSISFKSVPAQK